jgi:hypothetical protein
MHPGFGTEAETMSRGSLMLRSIVTVAATLACSYAAAAAASLPVGDDEQACRVYTAAHANDTWRKPAGVLKFPYLVPAGPYDQCWDWDSVFLGTATLTFGSRPYLAGAMKNFLAATNLTDGAVTGCLTRTLPTVCSSSGSEHDALVHAKPILIQGAWIAASAEGGSAVEFKVFRPQMEALLAYWDRKPRQDGKTGLRVWHDQMESGADNCVLSTCPNHRSPCWTDEQAFTLASVDVMTFLQREHIAFALFSEAWAEEAASEEEAAVHRSAAVASRAAGDSLAHIMNEKLWRQDLGYHVAWNVSSSTPIIARTYVIAWPLWAGLVNQTQAAAIAVTLEKDDMLSAVGLRSTSSDDPRYNNDNEIIPYSNWRGPMWVNANAVACYGLARYGFKEQALRLAARVVGALAGDLRNSSNWHEAYSTATGSAAGAPLAAAGFLSWDTLSAELISNLQAGVDPLALHKRA